MVDNQFYALSYTPEKNQINWTIKKTWLNPQAVPDVLIHWDQTLAQADKPGFKVLADMTDMKAEPTDVEALHREIMQKVTGAGVRKVATIISKSAVALLAGKQMGRETGMMDFARNFTDPAEAQAWLDE